MRLTPWFITTIQSSKDGYGALVGVAEI